jgi:colicin import membrane protein
MQPATTDRRHRLPRSRDNLPSSFGLALAMHALLFGGMTLAVQWRTQPAAPIVAELWISLPPQVIDVPPPPPPAPAPRPEPKPVPEPEREADIALKEEKKAPPKAEKKDEPKKEEKKPEPKKEEKKPEPRKDEKKPEPRKDEPRKEEPPRPRTDLDRILAQAQSGAAPAPGGATTAGATSSGVRGSDGGYSALVIGCIRPHIAFVVPEGTSSQAYADFRVELLPDASVASVRLVRASGLAGYDAAAERAIRRCDPFPRKRDGTLDRTIDVRMYPVEPR